jgi:hypothetical protein
MLKIFNQVIQPIYFNRKHTYLISQEKPLVNIRA